ncbi:MAG TPA: archease [Marmoricola sp.]|nr:archease [Marmoricola sp.]
MTGPPGAGHRSLPHTADVQVEAWARTPEECVAECLLGAVEVFIDVRGAQVDSRHYFHVDAPDEEDLLVAVLDELVYVLDTEGRVPVLARVTPALAGWDVAWWTASAAALPQIGAVPKAVSLHDLAFRRRSDDRWWCRVTLDV